ncbi:MAG: hypothetical protein DCC75_00430 [Proteobacteria bacterium]|nr:MAG: hypothetical protein DCC75_00430 [Pseudomonadota bacterium]
MIYSLGKRVFLFALRQFFGSIKICGAEALEKGPLLVVANHPNFFLDPLLVLSAYRRDLWFLAKSTIFRGPVVSSFLKACHLVPIYRRMDNPEEMHKNKEVFAVAAQTLREGDAIVIFPEGISLSERKLKPVKSGAARIAILAEEESDFNLGLKIQAAGLTYVDPQVFGSSVTVNLSEPLAVAEFRAEYEANPQAAVRKLTGRIEEMIRAVTVEVKEAEHQLLVEMIAKLYESRESALNAKARFEVVAKNVQLLGPKYPEKKREIEERLSSYFLVAGLFGVAPGQSISPRLHPAALAVLSPLVILGALFCWLPYRSAGILAAARSKDPVTVGSSKYTVGIFCFAVWFLILAVIIFAALPGIQAIGISALLLGSALLANRYLAELRISALVWLWPAKRKPTHVIAQLRDDLIEELEGLRVV